MNSKSSRNPNSAPIDERLPHMTDVQVAGGAKRWREYLTDHLHIKWSSDESYDSFMKLGPSDRADKLTRSVRWRSDVDLPPKDARPNAWRVEFEMLWRKVEGISLVGSRGKTLEDHEAAGAKKRADWLDRSKEPQIEPITVDGTPTGDLKPEFNPKKTAAQMVRENVAKGIPRPKPAVKRSHHKKKEGK